MICRECAAHFETYECARVCDTTPYGDGCVDALSGMACPLCGSTQVDVACECAVCEQEFAPTELEDGLCRLCAEETSQSLSWMWDMLAPAQKRWACEHTAWMDT